MKYVVPAVAAALLAVTLAVVSSAPGATPAAPAAPASASPVADGAVPVKLADGFKFTEGATSDKNGDIYFVDQDSNRIHKFTFDKSPDNKDPMKGAVSIFLEPSNRSNGMCFDNDGNLISCADEKNELWSINVETKKATVLIKDNGGKPMNGPNDVWVVPAGPMKGGMYITDPLYARAWWTARPGGKAMQQPGKYVWFLKPDLKTLIPVETEFVMPNGIIGTPDGKTIYCSDIEGGKTFSYTIKDDGTLGDKKLFCNAGSDGMTIDSDGNVYTTNAQARVGCLIWDKTGKQVGQINVGSANCCFGGKDGNVLFIDSKADVWGVKMKTHRVGPQ